VKLNYNWQDVFEIIRKDFINRLGWQNSHRPSSSPLNQKAKAERTILSFSNPAIRDYLAVLSLAANYFI